MVNAGKSDNKRRSSVIIDPSISRIENNQSFVNFREFRDDDGNPEQVVTQNNPKNRKSLKIQRSPRKQSLIDSRNRRKALIDHNNAISKKILTEWAPKLFKKNSSIAIQ